MPTQPPPPTADTHYAESALLAQQAASVALQARPRGAAAVGAVLNTYQATQAIMSERAVSQMLVEQQIEADAEALLNSLAFTTDVQTFTTMAEQTATDSEFERLVASLVQDAGRAAESVSVTVRPNLGYVWSLKLPSCSRCVALAGRLYEFYDGWVRHPNCDDVMVPVQAGDDRMVADPVELARQGQVRGLSKADMWALNEGADFGRVVNVRRKEAGLKEAGRVLARAGQPTPEGIYRSTAGNRDQAVEALARFGYIR